jgi:succinate dehydrogenase/fumarate reductase flavoprotein subunit
LAGHDRRLLLPKVLKKAGVTMIQRVMITELLQNDERVVGAMGFHMDKDEMIAFHANYRYLCRRRRL